MNEFFEILKYILPSLVVFAAAFIIMKKFLDNEYRKLMVEIKKNNQQTVLPIRLQAYERVILLLERTALQSLVMRTYQPGMSARLLQSEMTKIIRQEYDHNVTQQLYISTNAWNTVKAVKEELIKLINNVAIKVGPTADGMELSKQILGILSQSEETPNDIAINLLKKEIRHLF